MQQVYLAEYLYHYVQSQGHAEQRGQIHRATGVPCKIPISLRYVELRGQVHRATGVPCRITISLRYVEQRGQVHRATGVPCRIPVSLRSEPGTRGTTWADSSCNRCTLQNTYLSLRYVEQRGQVHRPTGVPCRIPVSLRSEPGTRGITWADSSCNRCTLQNTYIIQFKFNNS